MITDHDFSLLNILSVARTVKKGWRKLYTTFGGFEFRNFATEQLIERLNLLLQHYNAYTPISDKLNASLRYLQLQIGTNNVPWTYLMKSGPTWPHCHASRCCGELCKSRAFKYI